MCRAGDVKLQDLLVEKDEQIAGLMEEGLCDVFMTLAHLCQAMNQSSELYSSCMEICFKAKEKVVS